MNTIFGLIVLILDIIAIVDALRSTMDSTKKLLWIVVIIVLPILGMILYFVIGRKKAAAG